MSISPKRESSSSASERDRVAAEFDRYGRSQRKQRAWSSENEGNRLIREEVAAAIRSRVEWPPRGPVLDAGCGTGWWLEMLAREGVAPSRLYGVDILESRVEAARRRVPAASINASDVRGLPFATGTFGLVTLLTTLTSLRSKDDMGRALEESLRVLSAGGVLVVWDVRVPRGLLRPRHVPAAVLCRALGQGYERETITLMPPLARRLGRKTPTLYPLLARWHLLRTHVLATYQAPAHTTIRPR